MDNYTEIQIEKVTDILFELEKANTKMGSDCEISNLKVLKDTNGNIYISYTCTMLSADRGVDDIYLKVDKTGSKFILNYTTKFTQDELGVIFNNYKPLSL